ncbi:MAG: methyl-accepting chemotaxis protein [Bacteroidales bacterium]|nr:methyl-accepting chemotaxis protein [Bacteroidales bacterium]
MIPTVCILLVIMTYFNYSRSASQQKLAMESHQKEIASRVASEVSAKLENFTNELKWLAQHEVFFTMDEKQYAETLNDLARQKKDEYCLIFVAYPDGTYYVANKGFSNVKVNDRQYFKEIFNNHKEMAMTSPDISKSTGEKKYTLAVPIKKDNKVIGLLAANVSLNTLSSIIKSLHNDSNRMHLMVDEKGNVIADMVEERVMNYNINNEGKTDFEGIEEIAQGIETNTTKFSYVNILTGPGAGSTLYMSNFPIDKTPGWHLISAENDDELKEKSKAMIIGMSTFIIIIITLIVLITNYCLKNVLTLPLHNLSNAIKQISEGHLNQKFDNTSNDEIGTMTQDLHEMCNKLSEIVNTIKEGADTLAESSKMVNESSQQLSQGTATQASGIEELSATMEEMGSNIEQNTMNAEQTNKVSQEAYDKFNEVVTNIDNVLATNKEIAEKISIINDIAYQTNILALNAAVEAARAGDYGKGFAVVASEVRKLAENAKKSADEIIEKSQEGLSNSESANEVMHAALPKVENTSVLVKEIAAASVEQNAGAMQINDVIQKLNSVVNMNSESAELLAENAEDLAKQAENLKDVIAFFKD